MNSSIQTALSSQSTCNADFSPIENIAENDSEAHHSSRPEQLPVRRVAMLSVHTCPLAMLGGKKTGGMNVYVRDFSRELGRRGIQVDVFTRSQDDCQPRIKHDLGYGGRVIHIPAGPERPLPVLELSRYMDAFTDGVLQFAQSEDARYDLIHSHYWLSGLVAETLRSVWRESQGHVPIIHMFHTLGHMKNRIAQDESQRAPQERLDGEAHVVQIADRLIAATPAEQEQLVELYDADPTMIDVISPGVDTERFRPVPPQEAKLHIGHPIDHQTIVFAGRIEPLKGIDTLLEAVALIRKRHPEVMRNTSVTIIGGDPWADDLDDEMARLQEMRTVLGLHDLVTFAGAKDQTVLPYYYAAAAMVVVPSHYESFGMVALEAMAMGTPVIASEVGGLAYLVQDGRTGYHIPTHDPEALAARIFTLLVNATTRRQLGRQAYLHAQNFKWSRIVQKMMGVYAESLERAGA